MDKKIYTKKESFRNTWMIIGLGILLLVLLWLWSVQWKNGVVFLVYGVLLGVGIWQTMESLKWRKKHQMCVETQVPQKGWIVDCVSETVMHHRGRGQRYEEYLYYLVVEMYLPGLTDPVTIRSDAYTWPVYQNLASADVNVYPSDTDAGYTLDGFQYKSDKSQPDILPSSLRKSLPEKKIDIWTAAFLITVLVISVTNKFL